MSTHLGGSNYVTSSANRPIRFTYGTDSTHVVDRNDNVADYIFNSRGLITQVTETVPGLGAVTSTLTYNAELEIQTATRPLGDT